MTNDVSNMNAARPIVYFDGGCPVCTREIAFYRRRPGMEDAIVWQDVMAGDTAPASDLDRETALARFHLRQADGRLVSGAAAFIALWRMTPGFTWLGRLLGTPPLPWLAERAYAGFLRIRPLIVPRRDCAGDACATQTALPPPPQR